MWALSIHEFEAVEAIFDELLIDFEYPHMDYHTDTSRGTMPRVNLFYGTREGRETGGRGVWPESIIEGLIFDDLILGFNSDDGQLYLISIIDEDEPRLVKSLKVITLLRYLLGNENRIRDAITRSLFEYVLRKYPDMRRMRPSISTKLPHENVGAKLYLTVRLLESRRMPMFTVNVVYDICGGEVNFHPHGRKTHLISNARTCTLGEQDEYMVEYINRLLYMLGFVPTPAAPYVPED